MGGHSTYLFDLENAGWFGPASDPIGADAVWLMLAKARAAVATTTLLHDGGRANHAGSRDHDEVRGPLPPPQIAVFFDEQSAMTQPLDSRLTSGGTRTVAGDHTIHNSSLELSTVGASFLHLYLSDLPRMAPEELENIRLAVFLNSFAPSQELRDLVASKFRTRNITALFLGPAGLVTIVPTQPRVRWSATSYAASECTTSISDVSRFTGIPGLVPAAGDLEPARTVINPDARASADFPGLVELKGWS